MGPSGHGDTGTAVRRLPWPSAVGTGVCVWSPQSLLGQRIRGVTDSPITKINKNTNVKIRKRSVRFFFFFAKKEVQTLLPCDYCLFQKTRSLHSFNDSKHVIFKNP